MITARIEHHSVLLPKKSWIRRSTVWFEKHQWIPNRWPVYQNRVVKGWTWLCCGGCRVFLQYVENKVVVKLSLITLALRDDSETGWVTGNTSNTLPITHRNLAEQLSATHQTADCVLTYAGRIPYSTITCRATLTVHITCFVLLRSAISPLQTTSHECLPNMRRSSYRLLTETLTSSVVLCFTFAFCIFLYPTSWLRTSTYDCFPTISTTFLLLAEAPNTADCLWIAFLLIPAEHSKIANTSTRQRAVRHRTSAGATWSIMKISLLAGKALWPNSVSRTSQPTWLSGHQHRP